MAFQAFGARGPEAISLFQSNISTNRASPASPFPMPCSTPAISDMMSTHPETDARIAAIKPLPEGIVAWPVLSDADWTIFKNICN